MKTVQKRMEHMANKAKAFGKQLAAIKKTDLPIYFVIDGNELFETMIFGSLLEWKKGQTNIFTVDEYKENNKDNHIKVLVKSYLDMPKDDYKLIKNAENDYEIKYEVTSNEFKADDYTVMATDFYVGYDYE